MNQRVLKDITDSFLISWLRGGRYSWSKMRRQLFERRYLVTALPAVNSLEDIEACLKQVMWTMDGPLHLFDCISYPQTVWSRKKDDCDGFAILAAELLQRLSADSEPVLITAIVRPVRLSHTVCAFRHEGNLMYFDNSSLRQGNFKGYGDVVAQFTRNARSLVCWDVVRPENLESLEFHTC